MTRSFLKTLSPLALTAVLGLAVSVPATAQSVTAPLTREAPSSFSELSKRLMPAVVNISTRQRIIDPGMPRFPDGSPLEQFNEFFGRDDDGFRRTSSLGSGFVIDPDGIIVTNNHVIDGADEIDVAFADGSTLPATIIGTDADTDIAVLQVRPDGVLEHVDFADSDTAQVGDWVIAIGNPFGFGGSVSAGIVSARNRDINAGRYDDFIQTDAAINRGNSGGPLFDMNGKVIGVNTAIISPTGGSVGIGFSVPSNLASRIVDQILEYGRARRGWIGVNIQGVDTAIAKSYGLDEAKGVIITNLVEEGPAKLAGLKVGDLLLTFDGKPIDDTRSLSKRVAEAQIGNEVELEIVRNRRKQLVKVELGELEAEVEEVVEETIEIPETFVGANAFGLKLGTITDEARRRYRIANSVEGALVEQVDPKGPAYGKLERGDVILEIQFEEVKGPVAADEALMASESLDSVLFRITRDGGQTAFYALTREPRT